MSAIVQTAANLEIGRVIVCSAWGVHETKTDIPGWFRWLIDHSNIGPAYADHERQENLLVNSGLNYTIVRPTALVKLVTNMAIVASIDNQPKPNLFISRRTVARFMVDQLLDSRYCRRIVTISQICIL